VSGSTYGVLHGATVVAGGKLNRSYFVFKLPLDFARVRSVDEITAFMETVTEMWTNTSTSPEIAQRKERERGTVPIVYLNGIMKLHSVS
jgi:dissimilatory sulfite reductase (desulfoviridin) alpha/beta subunit